MSATEAPDSPSSIERFEAVVVGGGQAGLAVGHHLAAHGVDFVILSGEARIGDSWRKRWDSLRLFTPARLSGLPGMPFPAPPDHLPDKDEVADYLERYVQRSDLPVRDATRARRLFWNGERYVLCMDRSTSLIETDNVVVATGAFQRPYVPALAVRLSENIQQLHSSDYHNPFELANGPVLVVGAGNSGAQIALELARHRKVWLAGRSAGHLPRRLLGRDVFQWLWPIFRRASSDTALGRRMRKRTSRSDPLIGIAERALRDAGIVRVGRVEDEQGGLPVCDGLVIDPAVVVWCTGFGADYGWIDVPVFGEDGFPRHARGVVADSPGLYFLGLRFQHRVSSSLIGGVGDDAAWIASHIAKRCEVLAPV